MNLYAVPDQSGCPTAGASASKEGFSTNTFNPHDCGGVAHLTHYKIIDNPEPDPNVAVLLDDNASDTEDDDYSNTNFDLTTFDSYQSSQTWPGIPNVLSKKDFVPILH